MNNITIIILCWNQLEYTKRCIESLYENTPNGFQLILVDNNSTDGTLEYLREVSKQHDNVAIIHNNQNLGFAIANNQALEVAIGEYICFLNNDTILLPNWLDEMYRVFKEKPSTGIVGARLLYPTDKYSKTYVQHAGVFFNGLTPMHVGRNQLDTEVPNKGIESIIAVTGACMLVRKDLARFDEGYIRGYFEDIDLCLQAQQKGYIVYINHDARAIHYEGRSQIIRKKQNPSEFNKISDMNRMRFEDKWRDTIKSYE